MKVARLRQVSIKTARDWRDSSNDKWFMALEELKTEDVVIDFPEVVFSTGEVLALQKAEQELAELFPF
jgi:hypothetical protein